MQKNWSTYSFTSLSSRSRPLLLRLLVLLLLLLRPLECTDVVSEPGLLGGESLPGAVAAGGGGVGLLLPPPARLLRLLLLLLLLVFGATPPPVVPPRFCLRPFSVFSVDWVLKWKNTHSHHCISKQSQEERNTRQ